MAAKVVDLKVDAAVSREMALTSLRRGEIILFPTETVYGLGVDSANPQAIEKLYELKGRPREKPFQWLVPDADVARSHSTEWNEGVEQLAKTFWPGPLTLVIASPTGTIGWRIPRQDWLLGLLRELGRPLIATSANLSGETPSEDFPTVIRIFENQIGFALDGGILENRTASTVVAVENGKLRILRQGAIPEAELRRVWKLTCAS
jgi:L-threonylcarbamoyladenylate synthase